MLQKPNNIKDHYITRTGVTEAPPWPGVWPCRYRQGLGGGPPVWAPLDFISAFGGWCCLVGPFVGRPSAHAAAVCSVKVEAAGARIRTFNFRVMLLDWKKMACPPPLVWVEDFKYLRVLFTSERRMHREIDWGTSAAAALIHFLYQSVLVEKELDWKA